MLGVIAALLLLTSDQRSSAAALPRIDLAVREALFSLAGALPAFDRVAQGQRLYQANCASCHGGSAGGSVNDYPPRHNANGHTWHHGDCELEQIARNGPSPIATADRASTGATIPPGMQMPAFRDRLSDDEIKAILSYIKTLWTDEQRAAQAATTARVCTDQR